MEDRSPVRPALGPIQDRNAERSDYVLTADRRVLQLPNPTRDGLTLRQPAV
jgi:hypothetical protein